MSKTGWIILIVCLCLVFCLCAGLFLAGRISTWLFRDRSETHVDTCTTKEYKDLKNDYSADGVYTVQTKDLKELTIDWISGSVIVEITDGEVIRITETASEPIQEKDALRYGVSGGKLRIQACKKNHLGKLPVKQLTVSLPRSLVDGLKELEIDTVSASVSAGELQLEELDVNTVSGQVMIQNIAANEGEMDSVSGDVTLRDCSFDSLRMNSVSGLASLTGTAPKIKASSVSGSVQLWLNESKEVRVNTMSGHVALTFYEMPKEVHVDTTSALTSIYLPKDASCTVNLDSMSGTLLQNMQEVGSKQLILAEGEAQFDIDSMSGDVWIQQIPEKTR